MGEFNKDPNQGGTGKHEHGDKPAFDQFEKGQDAGQGKEQFGQEKQPGQQFAQDKSEFGQDTGKEPGGQQQQDEPSGDKGGQQQYQDKGQRQQGDEDLDEDSKSNIDNQGLK